MTTRMVRAFTVAVPFSLAVCLREIPFLLIFFLVQSYVYGKDMADWAENLSEYFVERLPSWLRILVAPSPFEPMTGNFRDGMANLLLLGFQLAFLTFSLFLLGDYLSIQVERWFGKILWPH